LSVTPSIGARTVKGLGSFCQKFVIFNNLNIF
jgi:hypothetical protein